MAYVVMAWIDRLIDYSKCVDEKRIKISQNCVVREACGSETRQAQPRPYLYHLQTTVTTLLLA